MESLHAAHFMVGRAQVMLGRGAFECTIVHDTQRPTSQTTRPRGLWSSSMLDKCVGGGCPARVVRNFLQPCFRLGILRCPHPMLLGPSVAEANEEWSGVHRLHYTPLLENKQFLADSLEAVLCGNSSVEPLNCALWAEWLADTSLAFYEDQAMSRAAEARAMKNAYRAGSINDDPFANAVADYNRNAKPDEISTFVCSVAGPVREHLLLGLQARQQSQLQHRKHALQEYC